VPFDGGVCWRVDNIQNRTSGGLRRQRPQPRPVSEV
jgi:hypothetical protein